MKPFWHFQPKLTDSCGFVGVKESLGEEARRMEKWLDARGS
jgi:hypothetical protein